MNSVLIIDKPAGLTSHDVVNRARRILRERSIGHLGTLDPMATGVLPLVTGNLTRLAQFYTASEKTYEGTIRFGFATDTYDADGEPTTPPQEVTLRAAEVEALAARFRGVIEQTPPPFSAKKIKGVPAYKLARQQKEVVLKSVQVEIKEFEILSVEADRARFRARVASGTYMRSVAHDMGRELACGAHLESLRRTSVAEFTLDDSHTLEEITTLCHPDRSVPFPKGAAREVEGPWVAAVSDAVTIESFCIHPRKLLPNFPSVTADEPTFARIRSGRTINLPDLSRAPHVKVFANQRDLIAIATRVAGTLFHPKIVLV
jgi:tRNA pseudouridine55 synthase